MRIALICTLTPDYDRTRAWVTAGLASLGHDTQLVDRPDLPPAEAAPVGYALADSWRGAAPEAVLALGWVAGLAAQVATRDRFTPVLLRLPRPGRSGDRTVTRVERALVRGPATVLASTPAEAEALVDLGARRTAVQMLPESVDPRHVPGSAAGDIVVAEDDSPGEVDAVLHGMADGRPAVVRDRGVLGDLVADGVSGIVVPVNGELDAAVRSLRGDPLRAEAMGMAAVDRVNACFAPGVAVPALGRLLDGVRHTGLLSA